MKVLITGAGGMLGDAVYKEFSEHCDVYATSLNAKEPWLHPLDIVNSDMVESVIKGYMPDVVIHLAALTDLEYCEANPKHAYDVNFIGTWNIVRATDNLDITVVYMSSAAIFNGKNQDIYALNDDPNPLNVYAKSKFAGELAAIIATHPIVIRAGWMMGGGPNKDNTFTNKIIKKIRSGAKELYVVNDTIGNITYTYDLAKVIYHQVLIKEYGLFHRVCSDSCTRVDITKAILEHFNLTDKISIIEVDSNYFKSEYFVVRPNSERIYDSHLGSDIKWRDCLKDYLNKYEWGI